jgi:hypothetical protein
MADLNAAETDFLGCGVDTARARINAQLPGPDEPPLQKVELARRAGVPTPESPSAAYVSHLESFVAGDKECRLPAGEPGLVEKLAEWGGVQGAFFRLTAAGAARKASQKRGPEKGTA